MRKLIFIVLLLIVLSTVALADQVYDEMKSMVETLDSSVVLLNKRIDAVIGYFEGRVTDVQSDLDGKIEELKKLLDYHEEALGVIKKTLESINNTMEKLYENQQVLFKYVDALSKNQETLQKAVLKNDDTIKKLEKKQSNTEFLVYLSIALSALNTLLIGIVLILK